MRGLVLVIAFLACLSGVTRAEPASVAAFTQEVARALAAAFPSRTVTVRGDLTLSIKSSDGTDTTLSLANLYGDYARDPARLGAIVETYVAALSDSKTAR